MTRILPCGPAAVMAEVASTVAAEALAAHLRRLHLPGVVDLVPAARTVLVQCDAPAHLAAVRAALLDPDVADEPASDGVLVEVPTVYDGLDLVDVASATGLTVDEVIGVHSDTLYIAAFCGFTPGFAYLTGLDPRLHLPRRPAPRPHVPAGSVAIGADFTGVYPTDSPGGWHLLGHTAERMWDPQRERPAFIAPGDRVRFVPVAGRP